MTPEPLRIGTRQSRLAMIQTHFVAEALRQAHPPLQDDGAIEIVPITVSGDWRPEHGEKPLSDAEGGKGLFAKELELALLQGHIDCAVHCLKDMPTFLPEGLEITSVLEREDPRDVFISNSAASIDDLPQGATIGCSSVRRTALLLERRPDLNVVPLRGNVDTRLKKLDDGQVDGTFLAAAGLKRLKLESRITQLLGPDMMLPAAGQGALCIEIKSGNAPVAEIFKAINHRPSQLATMAERAVLTVLDGSCQTPIGALAEFGAEFSPDGAALTLRGCLASLDGQNIFRDTQTATVHTIDQAQALGQSVGQALKAQAPEALLEKCS